MIAGCVKDEISSDVSVFTEDIVYNSGEQVIMTGRILAQGLVDVSDHGFHISTDENFSNPITVSLGEKSVPGRFVGQTDQLMITVDYYCRTFIVSKGETILGNVLSFSTLAPAAIDFTPKEGNQNIKLIIEGRNITDDTKVLWGDKVINPDNITAETFIEIKVPPLESEPSVFISIVSQGDTSMMSTPFDYIIGEWTEVSPSDSPDKNTRHIFFEDGDDYIYGLGLAGTMLTSQVHILDKNTFQRTTTFFPSTAVEGAFFNKGYFGGGSTARVFNDEMAIPVSTEFWKYENQSFTPLADVPNGLYEAVALVANGKLYLYGGEENDRVKTRAVYVYDISTDSWSTLNQSPIFPHNSLPSFHIDSYNYFVTADGQTYRHDYQNDSWDTVADFPIEPKEYGLSLILDGNAYVGMQGSNRRFFVFRPQTNDWRSKTSLPNNNLFITQGGWLHNDLIYVDRVLTSDPEDRVIWSLNVDSF